MNSPAGLNSKAIESRIKIKKRNVRPPVLARFNSNFDNQVNRQQERNDSVTLSLLENRIVLDRETTATGSANNSIRQTSNKISNQTRKKKVSFTLPRYEVRLGPVHQKIVESIHQLAKLETPPINNGINNSELFAGFLEFISDLQTPLSFKNINFKRGKLSGEGTERIKKEIGRSIKEATLNSFIKFLLEPDSLFIERIGKLTINERSLIKKNLEKI